MSETVSSSAPPTASHPAFSDAPTVQQLPALHNFRGDALPLLVVAMLALVMLPLIGSLSVWVTLTLAGLAMGMLLFIMSSGLTLVFGLMDVMNLGHASFVTIGAYVGAFVAGVCAGWLYEGTLGLALLSMGLVALVALVVSALSGAVFERLFIRPAYGDHLKQILVTVGALLIVEQIILAIWGPQQMALMLPEPLRGTFELGAVAVERYRVLAVVVGLLLYAALLWLFVRTRLGLLIRAGVENREMVEALGYRIQTVFLAVFVGGAALAGLGGAMWAFYREQFNSLVGADLLVQLMVVVVIGGLGSIRGCFVAALLVALMQNYVSYLAPMLALVSSVLTMVLVLLWRPTGLYAPGR